MPRSAASIQAEIDALEALLGSSAGLNSSVSADGVTVTRDINGARARLDKLYLMLGRANGTDPMFVRGRIRGLRR